MALKGQEGFDPNHGANNLAEATANRGFNQQASARAGDDVRPSIGFGGRDIYIMNSNQGSGYTNGIATAMAEAYVKLPAGAKPRLNVLDKEAINGLAYSVIVVSVQKSDKVFYFTIALEGTGRRPMKAGEIIAEVNRERNPNQNQRANVFTTDDAIDKVLHAEIGRALAAEYPSIKEFMPVDGVVVPTLHDDAKSLAQRLASIGYNATTVDSALASGEHQDLNITKALNDSPNVALRLEVNMMKQTARNEVDKPVRQDFAIELNTVDMSNTIQSINLQNSKDTLVRVSGYIDAIANEYEIPTMMGMPPQTKIGLHPHIIITSSAVKIPTPGYALLGIISALTMTNPAMWVASVTPREQKDPHDAGALNIMTNLGRNQNKIGEKLDLLSKTIQTEEAYSFIRQMFSEKPVISFDVESFGPQTYYNSMLAIAAQNGNSTAKQNALNEIIETANWLTNGNFPQDFPRDKVFVYGGVVVPMGSYADKTGERDIRDIDLAYIANKSGDVGMMNSWVKSSVPGTGATDPFLAKTMIIASLIPDAEISGKAIRVTFSGMFVETLAAAAAAAGLDAKYEPAIVFAESHNLGMINNFMAGAGVSNAYGFARQSMAAGPNFQMGYGGVGYHRH